jgi:hypothetical protein
VENAPDDPIKLNCIVDRVSPCCEKEVLMSQLPIWAQWTQLAIAGGIAVFAAFIAYRQWLTAHQRVVLDLFERRMAVYDDARKVIGEIIREGAASTALFFRYGQATDRLGLLFGDEVVAYSDQTRERINKLCYHESKIRAQMSGIQVDDYATHVDESARLIVQLSKFYDEFSALVMPYVRMTQKQRRLFWPHPKRRSQVDIY